MLKLKLQYFGHLIRRVDSLKMTLMLKITLMGLGAGGEGDDRRWDGWMASPTRWTWVWVNSRSWWWTGRPGVLRFMGSQRVGQDWATELNWTELNLYDINSSARTRRNRCPLFFYGKKKKKWKWSSSRRNIKDLYTLKKINLPSNQRMWKHNQLSDTIFRQSEGLRNQQDAF